MAPVTLLKNEELQDVGLCSKEKLGVPVPDLGASSSWSPEPYCLPWRWVCVFNYKYQKEENEVLGQLNMLPMLTSND